MDKAEVEIWWLQMIQVLSATLTNLSGRGPLISNGLQRMAIAYAKDFINGPAQIFLREPESWPGRCDGAK